MGIQQQQPRSVPATMPVISDEGLELIGVKFKEHDTEGTGFLTAAQLCTAFTPICEALNVPVPDTDRIQARLAALQTEKEGHVNLIEMIFLFGYLKVMIICTRTFGYINIYIYLHYVSNSRKHAIHCFYSFHTHMFSCSSYYVSFFSSLSSSSLLVLFEAADVDGSGTLNPTETKTVIHTVCDNNGYECPSEDVMDEFLAAIGGAVTFEMFARVAIPRILELSGLELVEEMTTETA